jgi:NAD dependent epimerase/dehydratase
MFTNLQGADAIVDPFRRKFIITVLNVARTNSSIPLKPGEKTMQNQLDKQKHWQSKRILVTGAGGFIGSHLVDVLVKKGACVRAFVRYNSRSDPGMLSCLSPDIIEQVEVISGDLRDLTAVEEAARSMDIIFHLGALIAIPYSYQHPAEVVETNIIGTLNILLAARKNEIGRIVHTSSSEVYGTAVTVPINEDHPLQGQSPYSASKIGADKLAESFYCAYQLPVVTLRPFNTYGPRQSARAVIPTIISQVLTQDVICLGNLNTRRDFTYVADTVDGFLCAAKTAGIEGRTFNLGVGTDISIGDLAQEIITQVGRPVQIKVESERFRPEKSEVQRLISDNRLARECLGWKPEIDLSQGLDHTIEWIKGNMHLFRPKQYLK